MQLISPRIIDKASYTGANDGVERAAELTINVPQAVIGLKQEQHLSWHLQDRSKH